MRFVSVLGLLLFFCVSLQAREKVVLQLQWLPQFQFAGYYVAKEQGFYADADLDVDIRPYRTGLNVPAEILSGRAQFGTGRSSLLIAGDQAQPVVAMAAIFQSSPMVLLVREDSGIKSIEDLRGKRVMLTDDVHTAASIQSMLRSAGIVDHDLVLQPHSFDPFSLERNETDAMAAYASNEPFVLGEKLIETVAIDPKDYGFDFYGDILFTSREEIRQHPDRTRRFFEATMKGWQYAFDHIEETAAMLAEKYNPMRKSVRALIYEGQILKQHALLPGVPLGNINPDRLSAISQVYSLLGLVKGRFDPDAFIYHPERIELTEAEQAWLEAHRHIRIGVDPVWPPIEYLTEDGQYQGLTSGYTKLISDKLGISIEVRHYRSWLSVEEGLRMKEIDAIPAMVHIPEREMYAKFTEPYLRLPVVVVGGKALQYVGDLSMLEGKKVAVVEGYAIENLLRRDYPAVELVLAKDIRSALNKVAFGEVDAAIDVLATVSYMIAQEGLGNLKIVGQTPYVSEIAFGVRKDWPVLQQLLQKAINSITPQERSEIYRTWVPTVYEYRVDYTLLRNILLAFGVIALLALYKYVRLDHLVKKRTKELEMLNATLKQRIDSAVEENRNKERMLIQQAKMATIGEMIESIAHQWRQPLNIMGIGISNVDLKHQMGVLKEEELEALIEMGQQQVAYMSQTIDDFRNFFKKDKQKERVPVHSLVDEVLMLVSPALRRKKIAIRIDVPAALTATVFPNELKQVLLNLVTNAKDAIMQTDPEYKAIVVRAFEAEGDVHIEVEDTGGGISADIIERIFDPYFTTKFESQGTGIGLYMSKTIVEKNLKGKLQVENRREGACFCILLPDTEADAVS